MIVATLGRNPAVDVEGTNATLLFEIVVRWVEAQRKNHQNWQQLAPGFKGIRH